MSTDPVLGRGWSADTLASPLYKARNITRMSAAIAEKPRDALHYAVIRSSEVQDDYDTRSYQLRRV